MSVIKKNVQMCSKREIVSLNIWSMNPPHNDHHRKGSETRKTQIVHFSSTLHNLYVQVKTIFSGILHWLNMYKVAIVVIGSAKLLLIIRAKTLDMESQHDKV